MQLFLAMAVLVSWEIASAHSPKLKFVAGSPRDVGRELVHLVARENLLSHMLVTAQEATAGLILGMLIGTTAGLLLWYSEGAALVLRPFILAIGTLPVLAFAPLMIVWFGIGLSMKVAMATLATVFVAFDQAFRGARSVSAIHVDPFIGMRASRRQILRKVIVPGSIVWVFSSMRLNVGFALLGAFIGEFIASDSGLGYLILRAAGLYDIPRALAAACGITVLALLLDRGAAFLEAQRNFIVQTFSVPRLLWK